MFEDLRVYITMDDSYRLSMDVYYHDGKRTGPPIRPDRELLEIFRDAEHGEEVARAALWDRLVELGLC